MSEKDHANLLAILDAANKIIAYTKNIKDALSFRKDGDDSESDAELTLSFLNEIYTDCFALVEI